MTHEGNWPHYSTPLAALQAEASQWGDRLDRAQRRFAELDGQLPPTVRKIGVVAIDDVELPENVTALDLYAKQRVAPGSFGALLFVNYEGDCPSSRTTAVVDRVQQLRRQHAHVPTALAVVGYKEERKLDRLKSDAWDLSIVHALEHDIAHRVIGISNDADTTDAPPDYLHVMTDNPYADQPGMVWGTRIAFEYPGGDPDLPMSRLLDYLNVGKTLFGRFLDMPASYGGSMAMGLDTYAVAGDWTRPPSETRPYGIGGPSNLLKNVWQRHTGKTKPSSEADLRRYFRTVDSCLQASPRREVYAFAKHLGDPARMADDLTTKTDNPIRQLTRKDIAGLAASVRADDPKFAAHLDALDAGWLGYMPPQLVPEVQQVLREARQRLRLPPPAFDK